MKWYPYAKGGEFRKWFGNALYIINWDKDGYAIRKHRGSNGKLKSRPQNIPYYFRDSVEWSDVGQSVLGARYRPPNQVFDVVSMSLFKTAESDVTLEEALSFLNCCVA